MGEILLEREVDRLLGEIRLKTPASLDKVENYLNGMGIREIKDNEYSKAREYAIAGIRGNGIITASNGEEGTILRTLVNSYRAYFECIKYMLKEAEIY